jgi:hypothetical protein
MNDPLLRQKLKNRCPKPIFRASTPVKRYGITTSTSESAAISTGSQGVLTAEQFTSSEQIKSRINSVNMKGIRDE